MIHIEISEDSADARLEEILVPAVKAALKQQEAEPSSEISILLGDDKLLSQLSQKHLGEGHATDVLSFPGNEINPETGKPYLGDIAISLARAKAQAEAMNHELEAELQLLVVHGVLHLLGHDHAGQKERTLMWAAQDEILASLNIFIPTENLESR